MASNVTLSKHRAKIDEIKRMTNIPVISTNTLDKVARSNNFNQLIQQMLEQKKPAKKKPKQFKTTRENIK